MEKTPYMIDTLEPQDIKEIDLQQDALNFNYLSSPVKP